MDRLIDTSVLIDGERGRIDLAKKLLEPPQGTFHLSVITASELLHGVERAGDPIRRRRRSQFVEQLIDGLTVIGIDLPIARMHSQLWAHMAASGKMIRAHDLWIAATCIANNMALVTSNLRDFARIPGLSIENWAEPGASP